MQRFRKKLSYSFVSSLITRIASTAACGRSYHLPRNVTLTLCCLSSPLSAGSLANAANWPSRAAACAVPRNPADRTKNVMTGMFIATCCCTSSCTSAKLLRDASSRVTCCSSAHFATPSRSSATCFGSGHALFGSCTSGSGFFFLKNIHFGIVKWLINVWGADGRNIYIIVTTFLLLTGELSCFRKDRKSGTTGMANSRQCMLQEHRPCATSRTLSEGASRSQLSVSSSCFPPQKKGMMGLEAKLLTC